MGGHFMFMSIGPAELKRLLPLGGTIEIRNVEERLTYRGTILSFSVKENVVRVMIKDVSFRPFDHPTMITETNGCEIFKFAGYGSRFLRRGLIAMKSHSKASIAYVCPAPPEKAVSGARTA